MDYRSQSSAHNSRKGECDICGEWIEVKVKELEMDSRKELEKMKS